MIKILKNFIYILTTLFIVVIVIFLFKNTSSPIKEIVVNSENKFLDRYQIESLITEKMDKDSIIKNVNIIEKNILANPFVKEIKLYQDLSNKLIVDLVQYQPIARLVSENKKDFYIDLHGNIFPTSTKFSERVLLIHTADNINFDLININSTDYGKKIFTMINYIINDTFLSKIISEIDINYNKNIIIYPQVSKQKIIFGYPEQIDVKFDKLMLFYKKILPAKGWNTYKTVNLKFKNQIICDKKS
ncbi:MAG TPA: FtsQ-type POTRA domain-containing protein [Cytophagales bacterium]|jgi:cell division protein FtsQ|nr:FtsQ-type POTRA domain-containing protein [Cytophagales bacterium]